MFKVEQYTSVFCSFGLKQTPSAIRFLLRPRGAAPLLEALSAWFLTALPQGPGWDTSPTMARTVHCTEGKHLLSHRASDLNRKYSEGKKANKVTQGCWAGWWQVWDWALLFCCSGGLRMKTDFVLVCWMCDNPVRLNFTTALSNSKKLRFYVSMHGECHHQDDNELSLLRKLNCIAVAWTWKAGGTHISRKHLYFQTAPLLLSGALEDRFYMSGCVI